MYVEWFTNNFHPRTFPARFSPGSNSQPISLRSDQSETVSLRLILTELIHHICKNIFFVRRNFHTGFILARSVTFGKVSTFKHVVPMHSLDLYNNFFFFEINKI